jgi:protein-S-isoprenylcysteine O-methyltransferase Ste14
MNTAALSGRPRAQASSTFSRVLFLVYGVGTYLLFLATFLHVIAFVSGGPVPVTIAGGRPAPLTEALLVNGGFLALFAVQHMVMARLTFKRWWTRIVPPAAERSTFVLATCLILNTMIWQWRAIPGMAWNLEGTAAGVMWGLSALGWGIVLYATFLIDHFHLFGLRQSIEAFLGKPLSSPVFYERSLYRYLRHPLMVGFLIAFWCNPHMSFAMLFFAVMCTGYILVGVQVEERTLIAEHGEAYRSYRRRVGGLLPRRTEVA